MVSASRGRGLLGLPPGGLCLRQLRGQAAAGVRENARPAGRPVVPRGGRAGVARQAGRGRVGIMAGASESNPARQPASAAGHELWPNEEAARLVERVRDYEPSRPVVFQSGFGPSGLPHLGTMCEILRPAYVRQAFATLEPSRPSRLVVFIDDMDGLRKVPENVPRREEMARHLGEPVSRIPDPFGCCASFADHMVGLLIKFLEPVEVEYELVRSSEMYASGA